MRVIFGLVLASMAVPAFALHILLTNDDGLTSNIKALYDLLVSQGHEVIVSVPCTGQSGRSAALVMYSTNVIVATNDSQVTTEGGCHNGAALTGEPSAGPFTKTGYTNGDFYYVHGTPVMATMYGLDVAAEARWGRPPHLVLSGPNEGQNVGLVVNHSGTIGNAQFAAARRVPAIALSAGADTIDNTNLADPDSAIVAQLTSRLVRNLRLARNASGSRRLLPLGVSLNVNFPTGVTLDTGWALSQIGTFQYYNFNFRNTAGNYGLGATVNDPSTAAPRQDKDEVVVVLRDHMIAVSAMQRSFDHGGAARNWTQNALGTLLQ